MEKEKINDDGKSGSANSLDFPEHFNQLELLETHGHLIPTGTESLWVGDSDEEEEQEEKAEEWYQLQEKQMENDPGKLLLWAAEKNRLSTVRRLLAKAAAQVDTRDEDEYTALHRAAYGGHVEVARELVAHGADVHAVTADGWTPLHSACKWNNVRVASFLLQQGANINAQTHSRLTPLHLAAGHRDARDTLELLLLSRYLQPGLKNSLEETALDIARRSSACHYLFDAAEDCTRTSPP
ncbi:ankyrin repeat domain-containing protein 49 [Erinaceus europaeus]|uniref:Ankyrin repeat domain-containing protein 49 n=1 Tax=Erinaceus europaeus TaxID=9365 RepID=A0A1S3AF16_ERIEU|nr:ankyrin repeat domain-containing protein 49 [Erinaceus europaeus]